MISVIIPVYNSAHKGLELCLQQIASQTYSNIQVLLVDDGSTDESGRICDDWVIKDFRFEVIHQTNQGPAAARNTALELVRGEEIAFVDSDDFPDVDMLQKLHETMEYRRADMAMARFSLVADSRMKPEEGCLTGNEMLLGLFDYYTPLYKNLFAKLYRRDLLKNLKFENLRTAEDIEFLSRVYSRVKRCAYVDQSLYSYNRNEDSIMFSQTARDYLDILQCYEWIVERISKGDRLLYGRALDALMRKVVSLRYRNRTIKNHILNSRLNALEERYLSIYSSCENGSKLVKLGLLTSLKLPWLHALVMNYREG